jgi:putative peptidoglycan lipid II flippase
LADPEDSKGRDESRSLLRGAGIFGALTAASRALGLAKTLAISSLLGAVYRDAFMLAFMIPNMFRNLFGEGALTNSFVPGYVERLEKQDTEGANRLASLVITALASLLGGICVLGIVVSLAYRGVASPGEGTVRVLRLLEVMAPFLPLVCLYAFFIAVLTSHRKFAMPSGAPMLLNLSMLGAALLAWQVWPEQPGTAVFVLAGAVLLGGALQLGVQLPAARKCGVRLSPAVDFKDEGFRAVLSRMAPVLAGTSAYQVCILVNRLLAKGLCEDGSVSYLSNSNILVAAPIGVVAVSMSAAALPVLSSLHARKDRQGFNTAFVDAARMGVFVLMPMATVLMVTGEPIIRLLFERGEWKWDETPRMARVLFWAAGALVPTVLVMLAGRAFYAMKKPWAPAKVALVTVAVNLILSVMLVGSERSALSFFRWLGAAAEGGSFGKLVGWTGLDRTDAPELSLWVSGAPGLALATCVAIWLQAVLLLGALRRARAELRIGALGWSVLRTFALCAITAIIVNWVKNSLPPDGEGVIIVLQRGIAPPVAGAFAYWLAASLVDAKEYRELWSTIRRKKKDEKDKKGKKGKGEDEEDQS